MLSKRGTVGLICNIIMQSTRLTGVFLYIGASIVIFGSNHLLNITPYGNNEMSLV